MAEQSIETRLKSIRERSATGDYLGALDLASAALQENADDVRLRHVYALELARSGSVAQADQWFNENFTADERLEEQIGALGARILKDKAMATPPGSGRDAGLLASAQAYEAVYERSGTPYSCINAATMFHLAGETKHSRALAEQCLEKLGDQASGYYDVATVGEAALLCGRYDQAVDAFTAARGEPGAEIASVATTRRQLRILREIGAVDRERVDAALAALTQPAVAHFCGQMGRPDGGVGGISADDVAALAPQITAAAREHNIGSAFGALAAGADIVIAEALLEAGCRLEVVLPFPVAQFREFSVTSCGEIWEPRFERCLEAAASVRIESEDQFDDNMKVILHATELAMGISLLRARRYQTDAIQIAMHDGSRPAAANHGGTRHSLKIWEDIGRKNLIFGEQQPINLTAADVAGPGDRTFEERAMLFGDVKGFSKLKENQIPVFMEQVIGRIADNISAHEEVIDFANTWGDGIYIVCPDAADAAEVALSLQENLNALDTTAHGLPPDHSMRIGAHFGPVHRAFDPVLKRDNFFGVHVSRAARIEPVAPAGGIYVSQQLACQLALQGAEDFVCEYVGRLETAKAYGQMPLYLLRRSALVS